MKKNKRKTLRLTPFEAEAILSLLSLAWADYDSMSDSEIIQMVSLGNPRRWLSAAKRADSKIRAMRSPQKKRGKPMLPGPDHRRANCSVDDLKCNGAE